jgi:hypothetical protein
VGVAAEIRLTYRAPAGNVVAVLQEIEELDGPPGARVSRQREFGVVARAFGREAGELTVPLSFRTPGWKVVTLALVTDERVVGPSATVEIEAVP